jgi:hypothetical protein
MPCIIVKNAKVEKTDKTDNQKLTNVDIMKKFTNIKIDMNNMKGRMFIHEFIGHKLNDDVNHDLIYT